MSESHQSLYQKYRPRTFDDVVGQDFVKKVLMNACRNNTIHHGYIFFGFHGTGKTTLARIFAQTVNCTNILPDGNPCGQCENCQAFTQKKMIDVIEIDAASYTGVDNIRDIIEHAKFTPTQGKYKIYIIDEVHMLSKGAFNALLKTLEEPPKHVIFLLATTEIHKVPDTVLSRVIRFDLERISTAGIRWLLEKICAKEGIQAEPAALDLIVHRSRGSMRDSLTILEKCILDNALTLAYVEGALHLVNQDFLAKTLRACISWDGKEIQEILETTQKIGINVRTFAGQMTEYIVEHIGEALSGKQFPVYKNTFDRFTRIYIESQKVAVPMDILVMSLCECVTKNENAIHLNANTNISPKEDPLIETKKIIETIPPHSVHEEIIVEEMPSPEPREDNSLIEETSQAPMPENKEIHTTGVFRDDFIHELSLAGVKPTLIPLLKTADIELHDAVITIKTTIFASKKCQERDTQSILERVGKMFWADTITILVREEEQKPQETSSVDMAKEIFE